MIHTAHIHTLLHIHTWTQAHVHVHTHTHIYIPYSVETSLHAILVGLAHLLVHLIVCSHPRQEWWIQMVQIAVTLWPSSSESNKHHSTLYYYFTKLYLDQANFTYASFSSLKLIRNQEVIIQLDKTQITYYFFSIMNGSNLLGQWNKLTVCKALISLTFS